MTTLSAAYNRTSAHDIATPVFICLLGPFRLFKEGSLLFSNSHKAELLLSTLALQPKRAATRSYLLDTLWPDANPRLSGSLLRTLLCKLRQAFNGVLGGQPLVMRDNDLFHLNFDAGVGIDVTEFETRVWQGDQALRGNDGSRAMRHYAEALDLYRGDLLTNSFAEVEIERERLRSLYTRALGQLTCHTFQRNDYAACLNYAFKLLGSNPFQEDAHRTIMSCYARQNQRGQALNQFQLCRNLLKAEFKIEPERETLALYEQLRLEPERV